MEDASFIKVSAAVVPNGVVKQFDVWVVVRHTRAGDSREGVIDKGRDPRRSREYALEQAKAIADEAALHYGHGSASVYSGTLTLNDKPEAP